MRVSEYLDEIRSHPGRDHKIPVLLFFVWLVLEISPAIVPSSFSDTFYDNFYFWTEDLSTIAFALACYLSLSYTSIILKGVALSAVIISIAIMVLNFIVETAGLPKIPSTGFAFAAIVFVLFAFLIRFLFKVKDGGYGKPKHDHIYLIVNKPHNLIGMLGLFYSGIGGGFSAYVNGDCYWFPKEEGKLVKTHDPDWYKGRHIIDCGPVTGNKINDLESMIGQKWSLFNNCFVVFSRWRRRWE